MEVQCIRVPLHREHVARFVAFAKGLQGRREEVAALLRDEGMEAEALFLEHTAQGASIVLFTKAQSLAQAHAAFSASEHPIQQEMRALIDLAFDMESASQLEVLLDMTGRLDTSGA